MNVTMDQETYRWNGRCWLDADGLEVCDRIANELTRAHRPALLPRWQEPEAGADRYEVTMWLADARARATERKSGSALHAVSAAGKRAMERFSDDPSVACVLAAHLRAQGQQEAALRRGSPILRPGPSPLRTTLAASLCDLGRWTEAEALLGSPSDMYSRAVADRIDRWLCSRRS
jgi:hypothetical protein